MVCFVMPSSIFRGLHLECKLPAELTLQHEGWRSFPAVKGRKPGGARGKYPTISMLLGTFPLTVGREANMSDLNPQQTHR